MFFAKKTRVAPEPTMPPETVESYLKFTQSVIRSKADRLQDLQQLSHHPAVTNLAFYHGILPDKYTMMSEKDPINIDWLLIGTRHVSIKHDGRLYFIGEFLIYISRYNSDGNIFPSLYVENVTPANHARGGPRQRSKDASDADFYGHPHISGNLAAFCMREGSGEITYYIGEGNIPAAFDFINEALHSSGPHQAFCDIRFWPSIPTIERS